LRTGPTDADPDFVFFATLLAGIPVFIALAFSSLLYTHFIAGIPDFVILHRMAGGLDSFPLLAVPFFILAGNLMIRRDYQPESTMLRGEPALDPGQGSPPSNIVDPVGNPGRIHQIAGKNEEWHANSGKLSSPPAIRCRITKSGIPAMKWV